MFVALVAGIAVGSFYPSFGSRLQPLGQAFISAVGMVVIPLVFATVTLGIYRMGANLHQLGKVALISFGWFYLASFLLGVLALALNGMFHPGAAVQIGSRGDVPAAAALSVDWVSFLLGLVPGNIVAAMAEQKVLQVLIFAVLLGLALSSVGPIAVPLVRSLEGLLAAMFRIIGWIVLAAPVAIFGLMAWVFSTQGIVVILGWVRLIGVMYLGLAIVVLLFCLGLVLLKHSPAAVLRKVLEPVVLGFTTRSSEVTLPVHIAAMERLGVPSRVGSIVLPLGYSFNLDGSVLYLVLATTFLADVYGLALSWFDLWAILLTTIIASKGIANVPSGSLVALATVLGAIGMPVEAIALIAGVDVLLDMGRTAVNVFGNTFAVLLVQRFADPARLADPAEPMRDDAPQATPFPFSPECPDVEQR
jgi:DAACS family dicarboxylate/amino acid:cation (Na+ or H+) symporter